MKALVTPNFDELDEASTPVDQKASFASWKFDLIAAMRSDVGLSAGDVLVAEELLHHMNHKTGLCFPAQELIAALLNVSVRSVEKSCRKLKERGWLSWENFGRIADQSAAAGLDAEFFQGIAYQASLSGVEVDSLASALATFAKNSGLAAEGKGKMVGALAALNPGLLEAIQQATTMEQRVRLAADAISKAGSSAEAAALSTTLFGDAGAKLVASFRGGAAEVDSMLLKAKDLGIVIDRDVVARSNEIGDKLDTAYQILDMRLKRAFVDLAPVIVDAAGAAGELARLVGIAADQLKAVEDRQYLRPLQNQLAETYNAMQPLKDRIAEIEEAMAGGGPNGMVLKLDLAEAREKLAGMEEQANRLLSRIQELQGYKPPKVAAATPAAISSSPNTMGGADLALIDLNLPTAGQVEAVATGLRNIGADARDATAAVSTTTAEVSELATGLRFAENAAQSFASSLIDDLLRGESVAASLANAFDGLARQLIGMATNQLITGLFSSLVGGGFGGAIGGARDKQQRLGVELRARAISQRRRRRPRRHGPLPPRQSGGVRDGAAVPRRHTRRRLQARGNPGRPTTRRSRRSR